MRIFNGISFWKQNKLIIVTLSSKLGDLSDLGYQAIWSTIRVLSVFCHSRLSYFLKRIHIFNLNQDLG